jgi:hypothetical protein
MAKPRTALHLVAMLDRELSWRRVDLLFALRLVQHAKGTDIDPAIRAAVPLLYAHWEGFVKRAACLYGDYLSSQRLRFKDVQFSLSGLRAHSYVSTMADIKKRIFTTSELLESIQNIENERLSVSVSSHIDRLGNLSHEMLLQIVQFFSLPAANYIVYKPLIDDALLSHRNKIAHGEYLEIDVGRYKDMHREVVAVIELFKSDVEDAASKKTYKR